MEDYKNHNAWKRLVDQLEWYDTESHYCHVRYKFWKIVQIVVAASIPVISIFLLCPLWVKVLVAALGAVVAIIESIQQLYQYSSLWMSYHTTAERLKHEKHLFLADAGQYRNLDANEKLTLLAERVEEHVSTEHANWIDEHKKITRK